MTTSTIKRIVCLANSRKMSGRCIAGKEILEDGGVGRWVRPVSNRQNEEVSEHERQYVDGSDPNVLDIMEVPLLLHRPRDYQSENWLLDPHSRWKRMDAVAVEYIRDYLDPAKSLWINGYSTLNGLNDRIPMSASNTLSNSLRLIETTELLIYVSQPGIEYGNPQRRLQGQFKYFGTEYWLRITDPVSEAIYYKLPNGEYRVGPSYLTISLGEPYEGYAYKLIAAVIEPR